MAFKKADLEAQFAKVRAKLDENRTAMADNLKKAGKKVAGFIEEGEADLARITQKLAKL